MVKTRRGRLGKMSLDSRQFEVRLLNRLSLKTNYMTHQDFFFVIISFFKIYIYIYIYIK